METLTLAGLPTFLDPDEAVPGAPLLVGLHGRGSHEWALVQAFRELAPTAALAFPRGPRPAMPGYAWYDLLGPGEPRLACFAAAMEAIAAWLAALRQRPEAQGRPLVLAGFSQGASLALAAALAHPAEVAGAIAFSGYLPDGARVAGPPPPVLLVAGARENMPTDATATRLRAMGCATEVFVHPEGHAIPPVALDAARAWLGRLP